MGSLRLWRDVTTDTLVNAEVVKIRLIPEKLLLQARYNKRHAAQKAVLNIKTGNGHMQHKVSPGK